MQHETPTQKPIAQDELLSSQQVRALLTNDDPNYGATFTPTDWERITARLTDLARLLWQISCREGVTLRMRDHLRAKKP